MKQIYLSPTGSIDGIDERKIREVFKDVITGQAGDRSRYELVFEGVDLTEIFIDELVKNDFLPKRVKEIDIEVGYRLPAFLIKDGFAYFGWVFWEIFTPKKKRKLFGSVVKNQKGDWAIQITEFRDEIIYVNEKIKFGIDLSIKGE